MVWEEEEFIFNNYERNNEYKAFAPKGKSYLGSTKGSRGSTLFQNPH
ncbi:hypothetical protein MKY20_24545 [Cytobacillus sp. FSL W8-0315]